MQSDVTQIDQSPTLKRPTSGNRATSNIAAGTLAKQPVNTEGNCNTAFGIRIWLSLLALNNYFY
jgi:hypothetical protein